ncbi:MAG: RelA/SpoT family protein [Actinomycetota bacterium]
MSEVTTDSQAGTVTSVEAEPSEEAAPRRRRVQTIPPPPPELKGFKAILSRLKPSVGASVPRDIEDVVRMVRFHHPRTPAKPIVRAFEVARIAHEGQLRKSGERFIEHPIGVARILAELGMDSTAIVAAFLHDAVEDTDLELEDLEAAFGAEVAGIIDGLTKISKIGFRSREQERAENLRKMIVAMAQDLRVLIIKLADRLHNMRTLDALPLDRQEIVATETLEIYAPLAHRLGMQQMRAELEDLAFKAMHPKRASEIEQMVAQRQPEREEYLDRVINEVRGKLKEIRVKAEIAGRPKHFYSIYEKMIGRGREFDEIFDLVGIRIIVEEVRDCYAALGAIHSLWKPLPGRFKDYIAMPKYNLYQSLHTSVVGPEGKPLEVQIRTQEMHRIAEWGIAAHWRYKEDPKGGGNDEQAAWMRRMIDLQHTEDAGEFLESLRLDLFADEVFVFTPKGDVVELPKGATAIDFAYAIHTEVGHACVGARVDGRLVPLDHPLASGETVEIVTSKAHAAPSRDWLKIAVTPRARTKIKQWFSKERREEAIVEGKDALVKALRRAGLPVQKLETVLDPVVHELKLGSAEALFVAVGEGRLSPQAAVGKAIRKEDDATSTDEDAAAIKPATRVRTSATTGVSVRGIDGISMKLARCCMPVPGDAIVGFVTRGRGVSIHRVDCPNLRSLTDGEERLIEVSWDSRVSGTFPVAIQVEALDRPKLLRDVSTAVSDFGVNIVSATSSVGRGIAVLRFTFELAEPSQLQTILATVRRVEAVYDAYRLTPATA